MIGFLFVAFGSLVLFAVGVLEKYSSIEFVDYYGFRSEFYTQIDAFLAQWTWCLFLFSCSYIFFKFAFLNSRKFKHVANRRTRYRTNTLVGLALVTLNITVLHLQYGTLLYDRIDYHPTSVSYGLYYIVYTLTLAASMVYLSISDRLSSTILLVVVVLFSFTIATRASGALLIFVALVKLRNYQYMKSLMYISLGVLCVIFALYFRGMQLQGGLNYISQFSINEIYDYVVPIFSYVVNYSFHLSMATYYEFLNKGVELYDFVVSLNPLPGVLAGWYDGMDLRHRVMPAVPYSALGELLATGTLISSMSVVVLAFVIRFLDVLIANSKLLLSTSILICGVLFIVYFYQYPIRTAARFIYYAISLALVSKAILPFMRSIQ